MCDDTIAHAQVAAERTFRHHQQYLLCQLFGNKSKNNIFCYQSDIFPHLWCRDVVGKNIEEEDRKTAMGNQFDDNNQTKYSCGTVTMKLLQNTVSDQNGNQFSPLCPI